MAMIHHKFVTKSWPIEHPEMFQINYNHIVDIDHDFTVCGGLGVFHLEYSAPT